MTRVASDLPDPKTASKQTLKKRVREVAERFERERGPHHFPGRRDPLAGLVQTLLSHNTTDPNAFAAYDRMLETYGDWESIHKAPTGELAATIRVAGLHNQKAERIQKLLGFVRETYGEYTADPLEEMSFDEAMETFGHMPGVKHKTLSVVMAFDLGKDLFPVDTHVHRLCKRLGFVPDSYDPVKTFQAMRELVPEGLGYQFHIHLIRHGRRICKARKPECPACFARDLCLYYRTQKDG
jgi:endonuclease-3